MTIICTFNGIFSASDSEMAAGGEIQGGKSHHRLLMLIFNTFTLLKALNDKPKLDMLFPFVHIDWILTGLILAHGAIDFLFGSFWVGVLSHVIFIVLLENMLGVFVSHGSSTEGATSVSCGDVNGSRVGIREEYSVLWSAFGMWISIFVIDFSCLRKSVSR